MRRIEHTQMRHCRKGRCRRLPKPGSETNAPNQPDRSRCSMGVPQGPELTKTLNPKP